MIIKSCPLIAFGETTPELSSQSKNSSGVETSTPECSGVLGKSTTTLKMYYNQHWTIFVIEVPSIADILV